MSEETQEESEALQELEEALLETFRERQGQLFEGEQPPPPDHLYLFPLLRRPFFPGMVSPLIIEPGPYYELLKEVAVSSSKWIGLILTKEEGADLGKIKLSELHQVGVIGRLLRILPMENGSAQVILSMEQRFSVVKPLRGGKQRLKVAIARHGDQPASDEEGKAAIKAYTVALVGMIKELVKFNPLFKEELQLFVNHADFTEPGKLADYAVALTTASRQELQEILETFDLLQRLQKALVFLKRELDLAQLQHNIHQKLESTISKTQKDFFLREQLKAIKKELGIEREDKSLDKEKFASRLKGLTLPSHVELVVQEEMEKLNLLDPHAAEYGVVRNYLDWLTSVPWGVYQKESFSLRMARKRLDMDHHGLEDVKKRIIELIGVGSLSGSLKGNILCLVGPPGVGKTSIGKSIAKALMRPFYRFSVGGMRDEAEIKGHRRTYIGAMPGKLIQALKHCKVMNPVIMLDEVDKIGASYHGDPASALLEVLDPEQNCDFLDHYLDVRCDLSNVLFIVTANVLEAIPAPMRDRMDVLRLSGYIQEEKIKIATGYLIPRQRQAAGLTAAQVQFRKESLAAMIEGYAREAGVRSLENQIKKILRKVAVQIVEEKEKASATKKKELKEEEAPAAIPCQVIKEQNLHQFLGKPTYTSDCFYEKTPIGVCTGLAWTALGGATLYIEAIKVPSHERSVKLTGQAGNVMKESSEIAWSYLHGAVGHYAPEYTFFENAQVHLHIPEGATPKDGPSAGITMVTAMLSLLTNTAVADKLAMTGELTLTGRVLAIGGVKEKLVAARRSKLSQLILPKDNLKDYEELPDYLKKGLTIHFVEHYDEVFKIAFPERAQG